MTQEYNRRGQPASVRPIGPDSSYSIYPKHLRLAIANPNIALTELNRLDSEAHLLDYIKTTWHILEPARPLIRGRVIESMCEHLEAVTAGQIQKILFNVPPGFMKSMTTNVFWPSWEWGPKRLPHLRYISWSYSADLTIRDNRRCRQLIDDPIYQQNWGHVYQILSDQDAKVKYENTSHGWRIATSVGGLGTGERGDRLIIDDPHNVKTAESEKIREDTLMWFSEVLPTRVNDRETSAFVVIMQRVHERDVSGHILANELGYDHFMVPMEYEDDHPHPSRTTLHFVDWRSKNGELAWEERFPAEAVDDLKKHLRSWGGSYAEAGQLQQRPSARGGGAFKKKWWKFFETSATGYHLGRDPEWNQDKAIELPKVFDFILMSVDASFKDSATGSRVSIQVIAGVGVLRYILDNFTKHMTFTETCDALLKVDPITGMILGGMLQKWPKCERVLVEEKANGSAIIDTMRIKIAGLIPINPEGGKESRASAMQPSVEAGQYYLPEGAPWLKDYIDEFASFPVGVHDDQVDASSQAHIYMTNDENVLRAIQMASL